MTYKTNQYQFVSSGLNLPPYILEYALNANETEYYGGCIPVGTGSITPVIFQQLKDDGCIYRVAVKEENGDFIWLVYD